MESNVGEGVSCISGRGERGKGVSCISLFRRISVVVVAKFFYLFLKKEKPGMISHSHD